MVTRSRVLSHGAILIHSARHATGTARHSPIARPLEHVRDALEDLRILLIILSVLIFIIVQWQSPAPLTLCLLP